MKKYNPTLFIASGLICILFSCGRADQSPALAEQKQSEEGWISLFDGKSTQGWHLYQDGGKPMAWVVKDGALTCLQDSAGLAHGDLVSDSAFENFELRFEWKLSPGGNSGVFLNVSEADSLPAAWASGPEFQLLDPAHADYNSDAKKPGAMFGFYQRRNPVGVRPAGEWNRGRILQEVGQLSFYVNDTLTVQQDLRSPAWKDSVRSHGFFKHYPAFSMQTRGHIALQDWAKGVSFRNIRLQQR